MTKVECPQVQTDRQGHFVLIIVTQTKPLFELEPEFDASNPYMKFGRSITKNE